RTGDADFWAIAGQGLRDVLVDSPGIGALRIELRIVLVSLDEGGLHRLGKAHLRPSRHRAGNSDGSRPDRSADVPAPRLTHPSMIPDRLPAPGLAARR